MYFIIIIDYSILNAIKKAKFKGFSVYLILLALSSFLTKVIFGV